MIWVFCQQTQVNSLCFINFSQRDSIGSAVYLELINGNREAAAARLRQLEPAMRKRAPDAIMYFANMVGDNELAMEIVQEHLPELMNSESSEIDPGEAEHAVEVAQAFVVSGKLQQAQQLLKAALALMDGKPRNRGMNAYGQNDARAHALLGNTDAALTALEEMVALEMLTSWESLRFDPAFDSLRDDLRFSAVLSQLEKLAEQKRQQAEQEGLL